MPVSGRLPQVGRNRLHLPKPNFPTLTPSARQNAGNISNFLIVRKFVVQIYRGFYRGVPLTA
ncbi:MAG: hypothetical protein AB7P69_27050, partial [Candidatus Binatia bacterium]